MSLFKTWQDKHNQDIATVSGLVYGDPALVCPDFQKLAWFIFSTEISLASFLPRAVAGCKFDVSLFRQFLEMLVGHYTDDVEMCFVDMGVRGSLLCFCDAADISAIERTILCAGYPTVSAYTAHSDVARFIQSVQDRA
jgi:hypothetical protein